MQSFIAGIAVLAAGAAAAPAITSSASLSQATTASTGVAPHTANHAPAVNPGPFKEDIAEVSQACFSFTSDNPNWYYANAGGVWGSDTGTFGSLNNGQLCVPTSNSAGGAMFIGPDANPSAGSTKLECFFPTSGTANCDASLVDGYSLSVTCTTGQSATIGGSVDLWNDGQGCPDSSDISNGICKNTGGYAATQADVPAFFQPAINNGNNYCIWVNCGQDYYFETGTTVNCHISGTAQS